MTLFLESVYVPQTGFEPVRPFRPRDFKSLASTFSPPGRKSPTAVGQKNYSLLTKNTLKSDNKMSIIYHASRASGS